jgi:4-alpha-glucanotransferase
VLRQWQALKRYANERGVRILGDLPIFVSPDSADVWADPELFLVDHQLNPRFMAGVPPDYFSAEGQLWGNPIYDWEAHQQTGYRWWIDRVTARLDYLDAIRIDHFRGFEAAWHVPAGATTAASGRWVAGPGADFFQKLRTSLSGLPFLAEDLGIITPAVEALRDQFQLPGMRVLQFAFSGDPNNPHLPHRSVHNGVIYSGTHDNDTTRGWYESLPEYVRRNFWDYAKRPPADAHTAPWEMLRLAWSSAAALAITPLQDLLALGSEARMNSPGCAEGQWRWRCACDDRVKQSAFQKLYELTASTSRLGGNHCHSSLGDHA